MATYIGQQLRELRNAQKLTQQQLATKAGLARTDLNLIENDKRPVGRDRLERIASALDVSVLELAPEEPPDELGLTLRSRQEALEEDMLRLTGEVRRLARLCRALERQARSGSGG